MCSAGMSSCSHVQANAEESTKKIRRKTKRIRNIKKENNKIDRVKQ